MKYKGAPHLQSASKDLNFFQYHSLDVIGTIMLLLWLVKLFVWNLVIGKCICRCLFSDRSPENEQGYPNKKTD